MKVNFKEVQLPGPVIFVVIVWFAVLFGVVGYAVDCALGTPKPIKYGTSVPRAQPNGKEVARYSR
jgi:hypothetical protein